MKHYLSLTLSLLLSCAAVKAGAQDDWTIVARDINPARYHGVTVANGMIGLVSSPDPMKIKDVVLNGAFDTYGRGRVDNILKGFNFMNINLDVDGQRIGAANVTGLYSSNAPLLRVASGHSRRAACRGRWPR